MLYVMGMSKLYVLYAVGVSKLYVPYVMGVSKLYVLYVMGVSTPALFREKTIHAACHGCDNNHNILRFL